MVGTSFWMVETAYFLIAYGWHWKAINEAEKMCDNIVGYFWTGGLTAGHKQADGIAKKGKTKGMEVKMAKGGMYKKGGAC